MDTSKEKEKSKRKKKSSRATSGSEFHYYKIPDYIKKRLKEKEVDTEDDFLLTMKTGLSTNYVFCDVYICVDKENIYVLSGLNSVNSITERNIRKRKSNIAFEEISYEVFPLKELSDFKIEERISQGAYTAKRNGNYVVLFNFLFSDRMFLNEFDKYLKQLKDKGEITFDDSKDSSAHEKICPICGNYYPSPERKICPQCMDKGEVISRLWVFVSKFKGYLAIIFISLIVTSVFSILTGYVHGIGLYDEVLDEGGSMYGRIGILVLIVISIDIITRIISMVYGIITAKVSAVLVYDLKRTIFEAFQKLSMRFFSGRQTGGLISQFNQDSNSLYFFLVNDVHYFFVSVFKVVVATVIMIVINPVLTLLIYITVPAFVISLKYIRQRVRKLYARMFTNTRDMSSVLTNVLQGIRVVKVFSKENEEISRFNTKNENVRETGKSAIYSEQLFTVVSFIVDLSRYIVWLVGGYFVVKKTGNMSYGLLMSFMFYLSYLLGPLGYFSNFMRRFANTVNAVQRLFEIVDATPDVIETEDPQRIKDFQGKVEFKNVEFSYEKNRKVIDGVSLEIDAGKALGIVGHTGAGKSTIANLITRLYDVDAGEILIDGINIKDLSLDDLHGMISIVSQETFLFMGTIAENIRYAKQNATHAEIIAAAKVASAHDFIMKLPDGYETKIGNGYKDLSGGERQRISIARAVLKNPRILIMDEATASMDTETERQIQHSLSLLTQNRTTVIIAHRLSTLRDVDKLIVIENGKMTESGTHAELIAKRGAYFNLYKMQAKALQSIGIEQ